MVHPRLGVTKICFRTGEGLSPRLSRSLMEIFMSQCSHMWSRASNIETGIQRVVFDELTAGLNDVAHEDGEHLVGIEGVFLVQVDFE